MVNDYLIVANTAAYYHKGQLLRGVRSLNLRNEDVSCTKSYKKNGNGQILYKTRFLIFSNINKYKQGNKI